MTGWRGLIAAAVIVLAGCSGDASTNTSSPSPSYRAKPSAPVASSALASVMTKDSGIDGIPLPADAVKDKASATEVWNTNTGNISDFVGFYKAFMAAKGWRYDTEYSAIDPEVNKSKHMGYIASMNWCNPKANPPAWDGVVVGVQPSATESPSTRATQVVVQRLPDTDACP